MSEPTGEQFLPNPFSPMAVAQIADSVESSAGQDVTIPTDAIRSAAGYLTSYLHTPAARPSGETILILGDYGSGKTHLARHLVRLAADELADTSHSVHIEATAENLSRTYLRFINELGLDTVRTRVSDMYADLVAEQLQDTGMTSNAVELLRRRELEPHKVVAQLHLMESDLLRRVHQRLHEVTANEAFGIALTLLLRPGFDEAVWSWLTGGEPAQILVEREITRPIREQVDLLDAMGVFALLFGGRERRFVLVIDEFDKIFSQARRADDSVVNGFRQMLEVFAKAGACLVLCGHPDFLTVLDRGVLERLPHRVVLAGLDAEQVEELIEEAQHAELGRWQLAPFTRESVAYLVALTGGNPRRVIRMCHWLFRRQDEARLRTGTSEPITEEMVRAVAREQVGALSAEGIRLAVSRLLGTDKTIYQQDHHLGPGWDTKVDFWLPARDPAAGCAILINDSVLTQAEVNAVTRRVDAVRAAVPESGFVLVVNGLLDADLASELRRALGTEPLVYTQPGFTEGFLRLVAATTSGNPDQRLAGPLGSVTRQIDELSRRQLSIYGVIEQLANHVEDLRSSSDRQLATALRELTALTTAIRVSTQTELDRTAEAGQLPGEVDRIFQNALDELDDLVQIDQMLRDALTGDASMVDGTRRRLRQPGYFEALGIAGLQRHATATFRNAIVSWFSAASASAADGTPPEETAEAEDALDDICRAYDAVMEYLPPFKLDPLLEMASWAARGSAIVDLNRGARRDRLISALDGLSPRVRRAVLRVLFASDR